MLYLPDLNAVFVAIPKTGSQWVKAALKASGVATCPAGVAGDHDLPAALPPAYRLCRRFCFVRNPLSWYESAWRGLAAGWPARRPGRALHKERNWSPIRLLTYRCGEADFGAFLRRVLEEEPGFCSRMFEWYAGPPGAPQVDYVGRQEHLREDLAAILEGLGWSGRLADVGRVNGGGGERPEWHPDLHADVTAAERAGLARWYDSRLQSPFAVTTE